MYSLARSLHCCVNDARIAIGRFETTAKFQKFVLLNSRLQSEQLAYDTALADEFSTRTLKGVTFDDYEECFGNKSTLEIVRALTVFQICSVEAIADNSLGLMRNVQRVIGVNGLRLLFKPTVYNQFVGGETTEELRACTRRLAQTGMRTMLAATMEEDIGEGNSEIVYNNNCRRILDAIDIVTSDDAPSPMIQLKLSGLLSADLLLTLGKLYQESDRKLVLIKALSLGMLENKIDHSPFHGILNEKRIRSLDQAIQRFKTIGIKAKEKQVKVLVDAEMTYLNTGLSLLTLAAVAAFNKDSSVIWNTYQCYLKDATQNITEELNLITELGCYFGAKLVRGAYMLQERNRAKKLQISDPICENYSETCKNYNKILLFLLEKHSLLGPQCQFIIASHNEDSIKLAVKRMEDLNVDKKAEGVCFGQLYGMCDQVSNPLKKVGLQVYKSIPYGTIEEVLPYLARRAVENKSVLEGARKELMLLKKELKRRVTNKLRI